MSKSIKNITKRTSKSKSKSIKLDKNLNYGIYDPEGLNINPLTGKPYENLYSNIKVLVLIARRSL